jgi:hypothetical protein
MNSVLLHEERQRSVDQTADRLAYLVITFGLLAVVAYRSFADGEASWDLLALVVAGGGVALAHRLVKGAMTRRSALVLLGSAALAALTGLVMVVAGR